MPSYAHTLVNSMEERVNLFLSNATVFKPNRYFVGFYGPYVTEAIEHLQKKITNGNDIPSNAPAKYKDTPVYSNALNRWKELHYDQEANVVDLKWACNKVTVPHVQPTTSTDKTIDSLKSIRYPLIKDNGYIGNLSISVVEDRNMMMYQFFNALINRFFSPQILKPRSSFQKLGMYIAVVQEDWIVNTTPTANKEDGTPRQYVLDDVICQVFEFNSIVPKGLKPLELSNSGTVSKVEYNINFDVPNTFQGSYKTTFKGLRDNTSAGQFITNSTPGSIDSNAMANKHYIPSQFEVGEEDLKTQVNGFYKDYF